MAKWEPPYSKREEGESARDCLLRAAAHPLTPGWQAESLRHDAANPVPMDATLQGIWILCPPPSGKRQ